MQLTPRAGLDSATCLALISERVWMGARPQFSARARGICSKASANALKAYCSMVLMLSASLPTARAQLISAAPPPYTTLLSRTRFLTTQRASCMDLLASSMIILVPPLRKMVTALLLAHSSITNIFSLVVPKLSSLTRPAVPSLSADNSWNLGNSAASGDGYELNLRASHPSDSGQLVLKEEMIGLVIKAPLTDGQGGPGILHLLHHRLEALFLVLPELLIVLHVGDVQLVLGLWLWGLEWTGQDGAFDVL